LSNEASGRRMVRIETTGVMGRESDELWKWTTLKSETSAGLDWW
jgi:hypothetical protein